MDGILLYAPHPQVSSMLRSGLEMVTDKKIDEIPMAEGGRQSGKKKE